jgi:hypothetical protein
MLAYRPAFSQLCKTNISDSKYFLPVKLHSETFSLKIILGSFPWIGMFKFWAIQHCLLIWNLPCAVHLVRALSLLTQWRKVSYYLTQSLRHETQIFSNNFRNKFHSFFTGSSGPNGRAVPMAARSQWPRGPGGRQWPRGLGRESAVARLLWLWVRV